MTRRRLATVLVAAALLSGCAAEAAPPKKSEAEAFPPPEPAPQARSLAFPFSAYLLNDSETHLTYRATDLLIRACMGERGHAWADVPLPDVDDAWRNRLHYGVIEPEVARRYGYRPPPDLLAPAPVREAVEAMRQRDARTPQAAREPAEQCRQQAKDRLTRNATASFAKLNDAKADTYEAAQRDPAVTDGFRRWSACMKERGHAYGSPKETGDDARWADREEDAPASGEEERTARDDVACKESTGLVAVWFGAEKRLQEEAVRADADYFAALKAANDQYLRNAREVLAGG
ncbi:hypothetical protein [Streptomyces sp. NPDC051567]|uniref:hypothetical protein n=1 Tax=Streptomyces sp. NPDC051567 TaxID=3365660 RepID=UPI00379AC2C2